MSNSMPMVPVPEALETVLKETAKLLWFRHNGTSNQESGSDISTDLIGRISAMDIKAPVPGYPNHNSSIMDGYAIKTSDLMVVNNDYNSIDESEQIGFVIDFVIVGKIYAGDLNKTSFIDLKHRSTVYVTTGAVIPEGFDAVIPVEETTLLKSSDGHDKMQINPAKVKSVLSTKPWKWIRTIGCDIPANSIVIAKGEIIQPVHLALLRQVGMSLSDIRVKQRARVGVLSTGNEVLPNDDETNTIEGKIPDVNRPLLLAQLSTYENCEAIDLGIVSDDQGLDIISNKLKSAIWGEDNKCVDIIITTGGISMGEKDIMEKVFVEGMSGKIHFGRMNMKPGKPTTFITIDRTVHNETYRKLVFALPGNPVSASVCTELLVRPCLDMLHQGAGIDVESYQIRDREVDEFAQWASDNAIVHEEVNATLSSSVVLDRGRPEYHRVSLERVPAALHGQYTYLATTTGVQRSSRILSLRNADGLMMLPRGGSMGCGYDVAEKGMSFPVLLLSSFSKTLSHKTRFSDSIHRKMTSLIQKQASKDRILKLGVIVCPPEKQHQDDAVVFNICNTIVSSLGGDSQVAVTYKASMSLCANQTFSIHQLSDVLDGPAMNGVDVIFVVAISGNKDESSGFQAGLELSYLLRPILLKDAKSLATQIRRGAASQDGIAALFENIVGTVRGGSAVLITCVDKGLDGAVKSISQSLSHIISSLAK